MADLPERVYVASDAYGEGLTVRREPLPDGPRLLGQEAEYVHGERYALLLAALAGIVRAAIEYGVNDEVGAAIAHAEVSTSPFALRASQARPPRAP